MIIGASSFASPLPELQRVVESIELYIPKLGLYRGRELVIERVDRLYESLSTDSILTSIHAPYFSEAPNYPAELVVDTAHMDRAQFQLMEECINLANDLGSDVVVVHPGKVIEDREACLMHMVNNLRLLSVEAENCGVILGLENKEGTDPTNLCCTAEELLRAIKEVNSSNLRATFDIGHANLTCGGDMEKLRDFTRELRGSIIHVHVHDNTGMPDERFLGDLHRAPGEGNIDFSVLRELHFDGVYNLEVFSLEDVLKGKRVLENLLSNKTFSVSD